MLKYHAIVDSNNNLQRDDTGLIDPTYGVNENASKTYCEKLIDPTYAVPNYLVDPLQYGFFDPEERPVCDQTPPSKEPEKRPIAENDFPRPTTGTATEEVRVDPKKLTVVEEMLSQAKGENAKGAIPVDLQPYSLAVTTAAATHFKKTRDGQFYTYDHRRGFYQPKQERDLPGLIYEYNRGAVELNGRSALARDAARCLVDDPQYVVSEEELHISRSLIAFEDVVLDLRTLQPMCHSPRFFLTYGIKARWEDDCGCPNFDRFLSEIASQDAAQIERMWEIIGYLLSPDTEGKAFFVFYGAPYSGKTKLADFICSLFTAGAVANIPIQDLGNHFTLGNLQNVALLHSPEIPSEALSEKTVAILKALTGNDTISADRKYRSRVQFRFGGKILLVGNKQLRIRVEDEALEMRLVAYSFKNTIPEDLRDYQLLQRFENERSGIVKRALYAYDELCRRGYRFSGNVDVESPAIVATPNQASRMVKFFYANTEKAAEDYVFTEDLCKRWNGIYHDNLSPTRFGSLLLKAIPELADFKGRKHRTSDKAAQAAILGFRLKEG